MTTGAAGFVQAVTDFIYVEDVPQQADVIFVPGARHGEHAVRAAELYRAGYAPYVLPSGGFSKVRGQFVGIAEDWREAYPGRYESEWAFLKDVLMRSGVPEEAVLREDRATYTWENAQLSREVLRERGLTVRRAILCCRSFHARRALLYYQAAMPEVEFLVCPVQVPGTARDDWYRTQEGCDRVLGEVARLGSQVNEVFAMMLKQKGGEYRL
jgi:uncharacterized SAM-binding protein YcdF (DUF218 family)